LFNNHEQLVRAAVAAEVAAFAASYPVGMYYLDQYTTPEKFHVLTVLYQQPIYAGVAKGNRALLADVNTGIAMIHSRDLSTIVQKWMNTTPINVTPKWILASFVLVLVLMFLVGLIWHNKRLARRVATVTSELLKQEQQVLLLTQNMSDWVWTTDSNNHFTYVSPSVKKLLGYEAEELLGQAWEKILHPGESERASAMSAHLLAAAQRGEIQHYKDVTLDLCLRNKKEALVWTETATRIFFDQHGNHLSSQGSSRNITERKQAEEAIRQLAFNDPLTHLPNRRLLSDRLKQAMAGCSRPHQYCALFFLDIDNFKYINDNHGHDNGDSILQQVAQRLSASLRESDTVARFGGDEFALISEYLSQSPQEAKEHALRLAIKTLELFDRDFVLRDTSCHLTTSIGIILFNDDQKSVAALIKQADLALYQAKASGRNQFYVAEF
jgi:diguanylate cyclase (GGDEF)-like protein/PAS domain S-box-containing protein